MWRLVFHGEKSGFGGHGQYGPGHVRIGETMRDEILVFLVDAQAVLRSEERMIS